MNNETAVSEQTFGSLWLIEISDAPNLVFVSIEFILNDNCIVHCFFLRDIKNLSTVRRINMKLSWAFFYLDNSPFLRRSSFIFTLYDSGSIFKRLVSDFKHFIWFDTLDDHVWTVIGNEELLIGGFIPVVQDKVSNLMAIIGWLRYVEHPFIKFRPYFAAYALLKVVSLGRHVCCRCHDILCSDQNIILSLHW